MLHLDIKDDTPPKVDVACLKIVDIPETPVPVEYLLQTLYQHQMCKVPRPASVAAFCCACCCNLLSPTTDGANLDVSIG